MIAIRLNGEDYHCHRATLGCFVRSLGFEAAKVAVERNCEIVPRSMLENVELTTGDQLEIVHFVGGG